MELIKPDLERIPDELTSRPQWVLWKLVNRNGEKPAKVPWHPDGHALKWSNPANWITFDEVCQAYESSNRFVSGIGFILNGDGMVGVDLDHCFDEDNQLTPEAQGVVDFLDSYTEVSPSGKGLHIFVYGRIPRNSLQNSDASVEIYQAKRFLTITGYALKGMPTTVEDRSEAILKLYNRYSDKSADESAADVPTDAAQMTIDALVDAGGDYVGVSNGRALIQRPNGTRQSGNVLLDTGQFYCHTDSWPPFKAGQAYSPKRVVSLLNPGRTKRTNPTQAEILLEIAGEADFMHDIDDVAYVNISFNGHRELHKVCGKGFKQWLGYAFCQITGKSPSAEALRSVLNTLEGKGRYYSPQIEINIRVARHADAIYIDLANDKWESVRITPDEWSVGEFNEVQFRRPSGMLQRTPPSKDGDIVALKSLLNVDDDAFILIVAWLIQAFNPSGPYPILALMGEQGTAKSTVARILRSLVDPNLASLRTIPRNERDLVISAKNSWVLSFDNLSYMRSWLSDALCRFSTGGGHAIRELYTDDEEIIFEAKRPIIVNGITDIVTRHDLADRALFITLGFIPDDRRLTEKELNKRIDETLPTILGGLLDAVSMALKNIDSVDPDGSPRMADFAQWIQAAEPALPWDGGEFMRIYRENRDSIVSDSIESNFVGSAIMSLMQHRPPWIGSAMKLLEILTCYADEKTARHKLWPKTPNQLGTQIRRISAFMRQVGIEIEFKRIRGGRMIEIRSSGGDNDMVSPNILDSIPNDDEG